MLLARPVSRWQWHCVCHSIMIIFATIYKCVFVSVLIYDVQMVNLFFFSILYIYIYIFGSSTRS